MNQFAGQAPSFSILDLLRGMGRRKLLMVICLAAGIGAGMAIITLVSPQYQTEARVLIDNESTPYDSPNVAQQQQVRDVPIDERMINSEVAVLQSQDLALRVIEQLNLTANPEFDSLARGIGTLKGILISTGFSDDPRLMTAEQRAMKRLTSQLTVYPLPQSNVIGIKFNSGNGQTAANVANALAETYALSTREAKSGSTTRVREWLSQQINGLRTKVSASEAAVEKFRSEAGLLKGQSATLGAQELSELNSQITLAEAASSEAAARADQIKEMLNTKGSVDASSDVLNSPTIQRLREQQVAAERRMSELSATYLSNHPKMIAAQRDVNNISRQIRAEALKVVESLQGQARIAAARSESLRNSLENMKGREGSAAQDDVKLKELEREAKANRDQLESLLARYADSNTRQSLDLQPGFARVIQVAPTPAVPYFPRVGPIVVLASLAGLGFGLGIAFLLEIMSQAARLNTQAVEMMQGHARPVTTVRLAAESHFPIPELNVAGDIAPAANVPNTTASVVPLVAVSSVPMARTGTEARALLVAMGEGGTASPSVEKLEQGIAVLRQKGRFKVCALAGVGGSCEVAASAVALGRKLAKSGMKTILVDLDGQRALPDLMDLPYAPGIAQLLLGQSDFTKVIQRDSASPLQIIRHGESDAKSDVLLTDRMEAITRTLSGIYDVILLHVGEASPAMVQLIKGSSTTLLFAPANRQRDAAAAGQTLQSRGVENIYLIAIEPPLRAAA